tara:strand:+ start:512 stop:664 length:153 start_codon:yes stop_codon:yes gene_type:complete
MIFFYIGLKTQKPANGSRFSFGSNQAGTFIVYALTTVFTVFLAFYSVKLT